MRNLLWILSGVLLVTACNNISSSDGNEDVLSFVNPFIGNADNGHTFPGACVPFGFIQASPETGNDEWKYCSGFNIADDSIMGFAQNHLNGTGCPDLGDVLIFPFSGDVKNGIYKSAYDKATQTASPAYYKVKLTDSDIDVEVTATQRTALMGEQPNPWNLLQLQDAMSRHRGAKPLRRCELLGVISLLSPG